MIENVASGLVLGFTVGDRIVAGETDEEREEGRIIELLDGGRAMVAWQQGVTTEVRLADCELV